MGLPEAMAARAHDPTLEVYFGGKPAVALGATVDMSDETVSASASVVLSLEGQDPPAFKRRDLLIRAGWNGFTVPVFTGSVEDDSIQLWPNSLSLRGAGRMRLTQYRWGGPQIEYAGETDQYIVADLLYKSAIDNASVEGRSWTLGTVRSVKLRPGDYPSDLIEQIDQVTGYRTFDCPDGRPRRRITSGIPSASAAYVYTQGENIFQLDQERTLRHLANKVVVRGLAQGLYVPNETRQAESIHVPAQYGQPGYITYPFSSDLIETDEIAGSVAVRLLGEKNRVVKTVRFQCAGNPYLRPGMTIGVWAPKGGVSVLTNYYLRGVSHIIDASGFVSTLTCEYGVGDAGYVADWPPLAAFTFTVTQTQEIVGGVPTLYYVVSCDGSATTDPDNSIGQLAFAWTNSANADVGSEVQYGSKFTQVQMDAKPSITLVVADPDGNVDTCIQVIDLSLLGIDPRLTPVLARPLYVAAGAQAEATEDGVTWQTWTPDGGATVDATPQIAAESWSLFGLSDGRLFKTADYLRTAPTLLHTFGSAVTRIWINEAYNSRILVGLASGEVWMSRLSGEYFHLLNDALSWPVRALVESAVTPGEIRAAVGDQVIISSDVLATYVTLVSEPGSQARRIALSFAGNYASFSSSVKREDGVQVTLPVLDPAATGIDGLTHHIRDDVLYAGDDQGRILRKASGALEFELLATIAGAGAIGELLRDGDDALRLFAAAAGGLYQAIDGGITWGQLRDYSAAGLAGKQVGYGALEWRAISPIVAYSSALDVGLDLWNEGTGANDEPPADWNANGFVDSGWGPCVEQEDSPEVAGAKRIWPGSGFPPAAGARACIRRHITVEAGGLTQYGALTITVKDRLVGAWWNGAFLGSKTSGETETITFAIDPATVRPGDNVLALLIENADVAA